MTAAALFLALAALLVSPSTDGWAFVACLVVFFVAVLLFARPSGDHDVPPGSASRPTGSGVTFNERTAHLVSAPARAVEPKRRRCGHMRCTKCGWEGHEGQMTQLRTLMGDGYYPGGCPECPAENQFLSHPIETRDGFTVIEVGS